jgi:hypothetical protein
MQDAATIIFVMSHACPLKCNFCCHTRDVVGAGRITAPQIVAWMRSFAAEPGVERFCFTGGEPFLYIEDIKAAVAQARQAGVAQPFHIVTAGNWARGRDQVHAVLAELRALGMDLIGLSHDHEHAKWVTPEQIRLVIEAAAQLKIRVTLTGVFWDVGESLADLIDIGSLPGRVRLQEFLAGPAGRARRSSSWPRRYDIPEERKYSCGKPGHYDITVYPDGEVYPCCAGGMNIDAKLSCGNLNSRSAGQILAAAFGNFHVRMVKEFGWGVLYRLIDREAPELARLLPRFADVDSSCEICRDLNVDFAEALKPIYALVEAEYARVRAELEWRSLDAERGRASRRRFGDRLLSRDALLALLTENRTARLAYLTGETRIGSPHQPAGSRRGRSAGPDAPAPAGAWVAIPA